jgi:Uma2 family endonuclease
VSMSGAEQRLIFPVEAQVPESKRHMALRTLLFQLLERAFAQRAAVGCDQFVYWDAQDPSACLAPDAFVRFGEQDDLFQSWKVWERGAPQVAVEIISESGASPQAWLEKLARYRNVGVSELVRFDTESERNKLRIWDLVQGNLVERPIERAGTRSAFLDAFWVVVEQPAVGLTLRLSHDEAGTQLFPTPAEFEAEGRRLEAEGRRLEAEGRKLAEARVRELEAELRRRPR